MFAVETRLSGSLLYKELLTEVGDRIGGREAVKGVSGPSRPACAARPSLHFTCTGYGSRFCVR
eukprot:244132-Chlamydomonas_euryale.AAC.21